MTTATVPEAGIAAVGVLPRRGWVAVTSAVALQPQQRLAIRRGDRDRRQGDRRGEPVGHQQVVLQVVDPVTPGHAQGIVRRRDHDGRRLLAHRGRGDRSRVLGPSVPGERGDGAAQQACGENGQRVEESSWSPLDERTVVSHQP